MLPKTAVTPTLLATLLLSLLSVSSQAAIESGKWQRYNSKNFEVYSKLSEKLVAKRISDLEAFRVVVHMLTDTKDRGNYNHTTKLMLLSTQAEIDTVYKIEGASGFMRPGLRDNLMVVGKHDKRNLLSGANEIAFHEYVHYLMRNASPAIYPSWYDEGFAELLSSTEFKSGKARVGVIPKGSAYSLTLGARFPVAKMLPVTSTWSLPKRKRAAFYARSWLLVHYLYFSPAAREQNLGAKTVQYLERINRGESAEAAFHDAYGQTPEALETDLRDYEKAGLPSYSIPLEKLEVDVGYTKVALTKSEIAYELGYQILGNNPKRARKLFTRILKDEPTDARALAGLGVIEQIEGNYNAAADIMQSALKIAPDDYLLHIEMGDLLTGACQGSEWANCGFEQALKTSAKHFETAYQLEPDLLETNARYASALNEMGRAEEALPLLEKAATLAPWSQQVVMLLGSAHLSAGNLGDAEMYLRRALAWSGESPGNEKAIREALMQIQLIRASREKQLRKKGS